MSALLQAMAPRIRSTHPLQPCVIVGVIGFLASFVASWSHSFWFDELATVSAARRNLGDLGELLHAVDLVHGLYYFFMHFWGEAFGYAELSLRFPSAVAAGLACAGVVRIGQRLASDGVGVTAGVVLALMPRMVWAGSEARQYAFTALLAVVLTLLLLRAWRRGGVRDWVAYGLVAMLGVVSFMFFALVVASHVAAAIVFRRGVRPVLLTAIMVAVLSAPFVLATFAHQGQVNWIERRTLGETLVTVAFRQFFNGDDRPDTPPVFMMACLALLAVVQVALGTLGVLHGWHKRRLLTVLSLSLVALPLVSLLAAHFLIEPVYVARYLTFTAPGLALLVALGVERVRGSVRAPLLVGCAATLIGVALVPQLTLKGIIGQPVDTARGIAETVAATTYAPASIVYGSEESRSISFGYPDAFHGLTDISVAGSVGSSGTLWGVAHPVDAERLTGKGEVWFMGDDSRPDLTAFRSAGCVQDHAVKTERLTLLGFNCK